MTRLRGHLLVASWMDSCRMTLLYGTTTRTAHTGRVGPYTPKRRCRGRVRFGLRDESPYPYNDWARNNRSAAESTHGESALVYRICR